MLQAGLSLLYQGMRKLPTKSHMLTNLVFWEITPGFSSALGISDANLRTGIFWGRSNKPVPCHSKVDHSLLRTSFFEKFSFPSAEVRELWFQGQVELVVAKGISHLQASLLFVKQKNLTKGKHWDSISLSVTLELCDPTLVQVFMQGSSSYSLDLVFNRWWKTAASPVLRGNFFFLKKNNVPCLSHLASSGKFHPVSNSHTPSASYLEHNFF